MCTVMGTCGIHPSLSESVNLEEVAVSQDSQPFCVWLGEEWLTGLQRTCGGEQAGGAFWGSISLEMCHS